jgi:hypothetical protein
MTERTGYDEAVEWLIAHAPDWHIVRADTIERRSGFEVNVRLENWLYPDVQLSGDGATIREAAERAIGGLHDFLEPAHVS